MPGLIPRAELNGVPQMFTADITAGFSKMTLSCSGALLLRIKDFNKMLYIIFNKWDLPVCPLSEIKIWTGLVLTQLCLAYSLALLWTAVKTSHCLKFGELILSEMSSSAMILDIKLGIVKLLFDSVFSTFWSLEYTPLHCFNIFQLAKSILTVKDVTMFNGSNLISLLFLNFECLNIWMFYNFFDTKVGTLIIIIFLILNL